MNPTNATIVSAKMSENVYRLFVAKSEEVVPKYQAVDMLAPHLRILCCLGYGGNARVDLAENKNTGELVAVKTTKLKDLKAIEEEIINDSTFVHPHICRPSNIVKNNEFKLAQMELEYIPKGDLFDACSELKIDQKIEVLRQLVTALIFCHSRDIVHCDIKQENILIVSLDPIRIKLCDFGLAFRTVYTEDKWRGTIELMSPEMVSGYNRSVNYKTDLWSLGAFAYELLYERTPWGHAEDDGHLKVAERIIKNELKFPDADFTDRSTWYNKSKDWINRLMIKDPDKRMSLHEALDHPFIKCHKVTRWIRATWFDEHSLSMLV